MSKLVVLSVFCIIFISCVRSPIIITETVYQDVYVPVRICDIFVEKPVPQENAVLAVVELKSYVQRLEKGLEVCNGGKKVE